MKAWPYPLWIAHRGAGKLAPENTLAAFRLGATHGYRALERTTNGQGTAGALPFAQLASLDAGSWHSRQFAGEPLPTLENIAAYVQRNGFTLNIEIKPTPGTEATTGEVVARRAAALWQGAEVAPLLSSFRPETLQTAAAAAPHLPRALLLDTLWEGCFAMAAQLGCAGIVTNHLVMNAHTLASIHALGMKALVYTVNEGERATELRAMGIDGIITDAVDQLAPAAC
jgi:glycerophosphoryl diester phosphodiesterase